MLRVIPQGKVVLQAVLHPKEKLSNAVLFWIEFNFEKTMSRKYLCYEKKGEVIHRTDDDPKPPIIKKRRADQNKPITHDDMRLI